MNKPKVGDRVKYSDVHDWYEVIDVAEGNCHAISDGAKYPLEKWQEDKHVVRIIPAAETLPALMEWFEKDDERSLERRYKVGHGWRWVASGFTRDNEGVTTYAKSRRLALLWLKKKVERGTV